MDASLLLQFWGIALALTVTPGADWAYAIAAGIRSRSAVPSIAGIVAGYAAVTAAVAVGVGAVVAQVPMVLTVLTLAGGAYLVFLGVSALLARVDAPAASDRSLGGTALAQFARGAGVSGINPKGLLLLLALLPQFTSADGWPPSAQMLVLGGLHLLDCVVVYSLVALLARRILSSRPRASAVVTRVSGALMILIGSMLLIERLIEGL